MFESEVSYDYLRVYYFSSFLNLSIVKYFTAGFPESVEKP